MKVAVLGRLEYNEEPVQMPRKARALLGYLAASREPRARTELSGLFCANASDPRATLRTLLSHIRRETPEVLFTQDEWVGVRPAVWVDCHAFAAAVQRSDVAPHALSLYRNEFLAGEELPDLPEFEMWLLGRRVHYKTLFEQGLLARARVLYSQGELARAQAHAAQLVQSNPYDEESQALFIELLAAEGGLDAAREQYERFEMLLAKELGVALTPGFREKVGTFLKTSDRPARAPDRAAGQPFPLLFSPERLRRMLGDQRQRWPRVLAWALDTAEAARLIGAYQDSAAALDMALVAAEQSGATAAEKSVIELQRLLLGRYVEEPLNVARRRLARAEQLLATTSDLSLLSLRDLARATLLYREGRYAPAIEAATEAEAGLQARGERGLAGRAMTVKGQALLRTGANSAAIEAFARARPWLAESGDEEALSICIGETAWAAINRGQIERAFDIVEEGLAELGPAAPPAAEGRLAYTLAACWNYYYDLGGMEQCARRAIRCYEQAGNRALAARCEIYLVQVDRYRFRHHDAQRRLGRLFQKAQRYHDTWLLAWVMALLGQAAFRQGRLAEASKWYSQAYGLRQQTGERQNQVYDLAWRGRLRAAEGQPGSALHHTTAAVREMEAEGADYFAWETWDMYLAHAEALSQNGREAEALAALDAGYGALQRFVAQIPSPALRQQVLDFEHSRQLLAAWESRRIVPFHEREHRLI